MTAGSASAKQAAAICDEMTCEDRDFTITHKNRISASFLEMTAIIKDDCHDVMASKTQ